MLQLLISAIQGNGLQPSLTPITWTIGTFVPDMDEPTKR